VRVGLGTDVAGGYSPSLLMACRHAVTMSKARATSTTPPIARRLLAVESGCRALYSSGSC
jgi:hypothetical protein